MHLAFSLGAHIVMTEALPFWEQKSLEEMSDSEWESLCDGCGRCCLVKLEDEDTGAYYATDLYCRLLNPQTCRCSNYSGRQEHVSDCVKLTPHEARTLKWLPPSCAYRLLAEGKPLEDWHPLISGRAESVEEAGVSVKGRLFASETELSFDQFPERIKKWPLAWPKKPKKPKS